MRVDGGMTVNNLLMQIQADVLGLPVLRSKMAEATALGAALAAGLSAGGYETFNCSTTFAARQKMQLRWKDALKRAFELAKFDPRHKEVEKPRVLKKPRFVKVSAIKPDKKGGHIRVEVDKWGKVSSADAPEARETAVVRTPGVLQWLAAETVGLVQYGDLVQGVVSPLVDGSKVVHTMADVEDFMGRPSACDYRILAVKFSPVGTPERSLAEVASLCKEVDVKWSLPGPRTSKWCVTYLSIEGLGFEAHHERMRTLCRLEANSWGVQEHFQLSMTLRHALQIDQLDGFNLAFVEVMFRRIQTIEYAHSERARESESRSVGGRLSLEEQQTFGGLVRHAGTLMICPTLLDHVKQEVEKEGPLPEFALGGDGNRQRDLFPLPVKVVHQRQIKAGLSRSCVRRLQRNQALESEVQNTVAALNAMFSGDFVQNASRSSAPAAPGLPGLGQLRALGYVRESLHALGPIPDGLTGSGALEMLRASGDYGECQTPASLGSYDPALLSLPEAGNQPVELDTLWGEGGRDFVERLVHCITLPEKESRKNLHALGLRSCYSDPLLRHPKTYAQLVKRLHSCGLVQFHSQPPSAYVELFFVKKKSGQLRMVVDCRHSNCFFKDPLGVSLATGDALSRIEIEGDEILNFASADLKDAFYHLGLPTQLQHLFGLRSVRACDVGIFSLNGQALQWDSVLYPRLSAVPMGWNWALWLCQTVHERIVSAAGANDSNRLSDKKPVPGDAIMHTEYVDNFHVIGTDAEQVKLLSERGVNLLRDKGLVVHEEEQSSGTATILGWEFSSDGSLRPTRQRLWKVRLAILEILKRGHISGQQLERVVGHMSFISMGRREGLCVLGDVYTFVRRFYNYPHRLWRGVRRELAIWYAISPLLWRNLRSPWSTTIHATDASDWGCGATVAQMPYDEVKSLGKFSERWRFGDPWFRNPRKAQLDDNLRYEDEAEPFRQVVVGDDTNEAINPFADRSQPDFAPLPFSAVDRKWKVCGRYKWKRQQSMPILEARSALFAVKHITRSVGNFGCRHLILSDSMTAISSISKGRAHSHGLRRVIQQIAALSLCSNISVHVRWLPSEWNPADSPSRGGVAASIPVRDFSQHGDSPDDPGCSDQLNRRSTSSEDKGKRAGDWNRDKKCVVGSSFDRSNSYNVDASFSASPDFGGLQETLDGVCELGTSGVFDVGDSRTDGLELVQVHGRSLPGWRRSQSGSLHLGSGDILQSAPEVFEQCEAPDVQTEFARMEEPCSSTEPASDSMGGSMPPSRACCSSEPSGVGSGDAVGICNVPEAIRAMPHSGLGCGVSTCTVATETSETGRGLASLRGKGAIQDEGVRRDYTSGSRPPPVSGSSVATARARAVSGTSGLGVSVDSSSAATVDDANAGAVSAPEFGGSSPVQASTRGSLNRLLGAPSQPSRGSKTRKVENNNLGSTLREGRSNCPASRRSARASSGPGKLGHRPHVRDLCKPAFDFAGSVTTPFFLELFSGSGNLSKAVARVTGWHCGLADYLHGPQHDLRSKSIRSQVLGWIRSGLVKAVHLGTPCNSFSRARDRRPGPPPLRSDEHPLGLSGLREADENKVREGNLFMRFSVQVCMLCILLGIPFTLENPATSRIWICPPMQALLRRRGVSYVDVDFCAFNKPWRKRTRFVFFRVQLDHLRSCVCRGSQRGLCAFTMKPHIPLMGLHPSGQFMTKIAEPYPVKLCTELGHAFLDWHTEVIAENFWKRLKPDGSATMGL
eukprot:Skav206865  [mRNA]  locus=scaffold898:55024:69937:- [translate_table: standard]